MKIGPYTISNKAILAPMAGVTDQPFRKLCHALGAQLVVGEMVSSNPELLQTKKTLLRLNHDGEASPRSVQIAGGDAEMMAEAAKFNVDNGAEIIDINMGCPAKKVCKKAAGSALLKDEKLVYDIIEATVNAVNAPVTLKIRTGWDREHKNGVRVAKIAEELGIQALAVHGRTRADKYNGEAEYETIRAIKDAINIPVIANGDILTPEDAERVLKYTEADAVMIGRGAQGKPWIFREVNHYLENNSFLPEISTHEIQIIMSNHLNALYAFYGEYMGCRIARKHVGWYCQQQGLSELKKQFNTFDNCNDQLEYLNVLTSYAAKEQISR